MGANDVRSHRRSRRQRTSFTASWRVRALGESEFNDSCSRLAPSEHKCVTNTIAPDLRLSGRLRSSSASDLIRAGHQRLRSRGRKLDNDEEYAGCPARLKTVLQLIVARVQGTSEIFLDRLRQIDIFGQNCALPVAGGSRASRPFSDVHAAHVEAGIEVVETTQR